MRDKRILLTLFLLLATTNYAATVEGSADEVEIDLNTNTMTSKDGVVLKQSNMKTKVHTVQRDTKRGMTYYRDGVIVQVDSPTGVMKIESQEGEADSKTQEANFYKNFGYLEVGAVTGAEAPNDRIYFGSDHIQHKDDKIYINHAWTTTDFKIINHAKNPNEVDYHILSRQMVVEPDKQLTIYDSNLYLKDRKMLPFGFPWFRMNIRSGSEVPLFLTWGEKSYYGWYMSWGALYGDKKDKLRGGIAPKFADNMGWMLGRWETWYDTKKYGEVQANISDLMLYSKVRGKKEETNKIEYEQKNKRYHVETKHDYKGEYGSFHFLGLNATTSMISPLNDLITKYEANGEFTNTRGIKGTGVYFDRPHFDKNIGFYNMKSDLKGMGKNKDISLTGDLKLTTNKELYTLNIYDNVKDNVFETKTDNALYANVALYQDNARYKMGGYYNYLYDVTPGYTTKYQRSRGRDYGWIIFDKENQIGIQYDETQGDKLRNLNLWEIESDASSLKTRNPMNLPIDYTPVAVSEYSQHDTKDWNVSLGDYQVGKYHVRPSFSSGFIVKRLDLLENKTIVIRDNSSATSDIYTRKDGYERLQQYNRFNNELYSKSRENKANINIFEKENISVNFFGGNKKEDILVRDGEIGAEEARRIVSDSTFYGMNLEKKNISLGSFGTIAFRGDLRYDDYKNSDGSSWKWGVGLNHDVVLYETSAMKISNNLDVYTQRYHYQSRKNEDKAENLYTKTDSYQIKDTFSLDTTNVNTIYQGRYQLDKNPYTRADKKAEVLEQKIDFKLAEDKKIGFFYNDDTRYTNRIVTGDRSRKDLKMQNYGLDFQYGAHGFAYQRYNVNFIPVPYSREDIRSDSYRYSYAWDDKKIAFYYRTGKDKINIEGFHNPTVLDIDNKVYGISFHKVGEIEHDTYLNYENSSHKEGGSKIDFNGKRENIEHTDAINFSYQYRDTRLTDSEYIKYASLETGKAEDEISTQDVEKIKSILSQQQTDQDPFRLTGIREDAFLFGDNRVNFRFFGTLQRNKAQYQRTNDFGESLQKIKGGVFYTYNRYGLGYTIEQNAGWTGTGSTYEWRKKNREHQVSLYAKVGKPSNSWRVKTYAKFYENLLDKVNEDQKNKRPLDGIGVEIGKEFGFYEWSMVYERAYSLTARDYEWRVGLQFTLLTFPDNSIFGIGAKKSSNKTKVKTEFMESIKIKNIVSSDLDTKNIMKK